MSGRSSGRGTSGRSSGRGPGNATLALVVALVAGLGCHRGDGLVGRQAPEFSLADLSGRAVRLANYRGRVVFLNVWATWCEPCREEMPSMQAVYERFHGPDFEMLAVSADQGGSDVVERFVADIGLKFPVLLDPELQIADRYEVTGYPETFLIDRNGRVVGHVIGPRDWGTPDNQAAIRKLIDRGEW